jgi:hypothetical protein
MRALRTMPVPVVAMTDRASANAMALAQPLPPIAWAV